MAWVDSTFLGVIAMGAGRDGENSSLSLTKFINDEDDSCRDGKVEVCEKRCIYK